MGNPLPLSPSPVLQTQRNMEAKNPTIQPLGLVLSALLQEKRKEGPADPRKSIEYLWGCILRAEGIGALQSDCWIYIWFHQSPTAFQNSHTYTTPTPTPPHTLVTQPADHHRCVMRGAYADRHSNLLGLFGRAECSSQIDPRLNVAEDRFHRTMRVSKF